jgi:hypothetical protein
VPSCPKRARIGGGAVGGTVGAEFVRATFSRGAIFKNATFNHAIFKSAIFLDGAKFADATFQGLSLFVNAEMKGVTSFENATFETEPPLFSGAKLHQGTVWRGITWPPPPKNTVEAGRFLDAYACLKLEMDRLKKHEKLAMSEKVAPTKSAPLTKVA